MGSDETSSYSDLSGTQTVTFNDIRKYSAVLMAFPIRAAAQPYLGVGYGIMHVVSPTPSSPTAFQSDAEELGSTGFGTFLAGITFQVGRLMAFGQYQITTSPGNRRRLRRRRQRRGLRPAAHRARPTRSPAACGSAWAARARR